MMTRHEGQLISERRLKHIRLAFAIFEIEEPSPLSWDVGRLPYPSQGAVTLDEVYLASLEGMASLNPSRHVRIGCAALIERIVENDDLRVLLAATRLLDVAIDRVVRRGLPERLDLKAALAIGKTASVHNPVSRLFVLINDKGAAYAMLLQGFRGFQLVLVVFSRLLRSGLPRLSLRFVITDFRLLAGSQPLGVAGFHLGEDGARGGIVRVEDLLLRWHATAEYGCRAVEVAPIHRVEVVVLIFDREEPPYPFRSVHTSYESSDVVMRPSRTAW